METKKILVVDDEEILRMLITDTLEFEGYAVEEAEDGKEGYERIVQDPFDLIILDYMMPYMTGMEVLEKIQPLQLGVPIIMLTAKAQQHDRDMAHQFGAKYFMPKPFSPSELVALVNDILNG
ncbi:response regulator transcription factor [Sporosarcina sp. 179-K 3D1 HS]|uniref:response regulator transcription factor n=1 Tax=Sporosarcina sp. 179-K 3D1 HS TaxID=3232169 RepID=UPI00399FA9BF